MALSSTIYKIQLSVSDLDRSYFAEHSLTLACHPSETHERLFVRVLAFCFHASDLIRWGKGLSQADEPALWEERPDGTVPLWIETGLPAADRLRKAHGKADEVVVYCFGDRRVGPWWDGLQSSLSRLPALSVYQFSSQSLQQLENMLSRQTRLYVTIQENEILLSDASSTGAIDRRVLLRPEHQQ